MMIDIFKLNSSNSAIMQCVKSQNYELEMYQLRNVLNGNVSNGNESNERNQKYSLDW